MQSHLLKIPPCVEVMVQFKYQTGYSVKDKVGWNIVSDVRLTDQQIESVIEKEFPSPGYGVSSYGRISDFVVAVSSNASCE